MCCYIHTYTVLIHTSDGDSITSCSINSYSASRDNWCTVTLWNRIMTAQCEGMGEVGSARYEPALLPPCPSIRVLRYSNCQEIHSRQQTPADGPGSVSVNITFCTLCDVMIWAMLANVACITGLHHNVAVLQQSRQNALCISWEANTTLW